VVYGTTPDLKLFALDATTGVQKWRFDPAACEGITKSGVNRGLVYWAEGSDRRILYANDHFLHAIDRFAR
jgi:quinoprotein glucose dehydrogenase